MPATGEGCGLCVPRPGEMANLPSRERVYSDGYWRVLANKSALRGWLLVPTVRHVETLAELTSAEQASIGRVLAVGSRALMEVVGCVKTYAMMFAEGTPHVHFSLVPRMADIPSHLKGAHVSGYNAEGAPLSEEERDAIADALRPRFANLAPSGP